MTAIRVSHSMPLRANVASLGLAALGLAAALLLAQLSIRANLARACMVNDTPYFDLCAKPFGPQQRVAELKTRISANPGDSRAYADLASTQPAASRGASLEAAARLAPANPSVTAMRAVQAIEQQDLPAAVRPLVALTEYEHSDKAALVLARMIASGRWQLLAEHLTPGSRWLQRVLAQLPNAQGQFSAALPLVVIALDKDILGRDELMPYVRQLKSAGAWNDAYSLWVALHRAVLPALYNAGFDQPFENDAFDWEVTAQQPSGRAGALVSRVSDEARGSVLDIRFTGRPFAVPLVRQTVFLGPGRYRLRGEYKTTQLRVEQGLAWSLHCTASPQSAKSAALADTANAWTGFEFVFEVPAQCGWVANLQLETVAAIDATLGGRGRASFDALSLEKLEHRRPLP